MCVTAVSTGNRKLPRFRFSASAPDASATDENSVVRRNYTMIMTFNELKITDPILKAIGEKGYLAPTPIQQKGIPVALDGRDMLGIAQTGTGKTCLLYTSPSPRD